VCSYGQALACGFRRCGVSRAESRECAARIFDDDEDCAAFLRIAAEAIDRVPLELPACCVMLNRWHLVLRPREDGDLSRFTGWLTLTHTQRWHAHRHTTGSGHLYQGKFPLTRGAAKAASRTRQGGIGRESRVQSSPGSERPSFSDPLPLRGAQPLRAGLIERAEQWAWSSLSARLQEIPTHERPGLSDSPIDPPSDSLDVVNQPQSPQREEAIRTSMARRGPLGDPAWQQRTAAKLGLELTLRPRGRPRKRMTIGS
jgi:putative transposase